MSWGSLEELMLPCFSHPTVLCFLVSKTYFKDGVTLPYTKNEFSVHPLLSPEAKDVR